MNGADRRKGEWEYKFCINRQYSLKSINFFVIRNTFEAIE